MPIDSKVLGKSSSPVVNSALQGPSGKGQPITIAKGSKAIPSYNKQPVTVPRKKS
jgi:hypothetical protein